MKSENSVARAIRLTRKWPVFARYAVKTAIVALILTIRQMGDPILGDHERFLLFFVAILLASTLFDRGSGLFATILSTIAVTFFYLPPVHSLAIPGSAQLISLLIFVGIGSLLACIVEAMHQAIEQLQATKSKLLEEQRGRALLLEEFRHRTRNDLGSLVGILLLRARVATSDAAREGLREAADHAMALARVHTRLAQDAVTAADVATADTREFIIGLCDDLDKAMAGEGLRPISLIVQAEAHHLATERSVQLGLVLNEAITNAFKYAFPEGRGGTVQVSFKRDGDDFVLTVSDDGPGVLPSGDMDDTPPARVSQGSGLGTRLLRALAAQLRGSFARHPGENAVGTIVELRFPVAAPSRPTH